MLNILHGRKISIIYVLFTICISVVTLDKGLGYSKKYSVTAVAQLV